MEICGISEICNLNPERDFLLKHIQFNKTFTSADGVYLYDQKGNKYLDFLAQYGAVPFGHNPPDIWQALINCNGEPAMVQPFYTEGVKELAQQLISLEPEFNFSYVIFTNSGAESVEAALKMAKAATGRDKVVSLHLGFHGKTSGALAVTGNPVYSEPFRIDTTNSIKIEPENIEQMELAFAENEIAAFILETVLGEGGMQPLSDEYIQKAYALCKEHGALMIADEIQTGMGRLGEFFSIKNIPGVIPDIICLAKALGGGLVPIGAVLCNKKSWSEEFGLYHSSTFANNQIVCRVALATITKLNANDKAIMLHVNSVAKYLGDELDAIVEKYPDVFIQHQGSGLMHSLKIRPFDGKDSYFLSHASVQGYIVPLICGYLLNVSKIIVAPLFNRQDLLRIEPPLIIEKSHIDQLIEALDKCAHIIRNEQFSSLLAYLINRQPEEVSYSEKSSPSLVVTDTQLANISSGEKKLGSFAFLIHPTSDEDLFNIMPSSLIGLDKLHRREFQQWMQSWFSKRYEPAPVFHAKKIRSKSGGYVEGWLIACPLPPERMMKLSKRSRQKLLLQYIECAKGLGADIVGLGAFTSIISRGGTDIKDADIHITTGNSFTAIASAESLHNALHATGQSHADTRIAIVGSAGSVGRLAAMHLSEYYAMITLVGNAGNVHAMATLEEIAGEIYAQALTKVQSGGNTGLARYLLAHLTEPFIVIHRCNQIILRDENPDFSAIRTIVEESLTSDAPIRISVNAEDGISMAHGVLSATSQGNSFLEASWFKDKSVVCDAARPPDIQSNVLDERPDVLVFEGGVVKFSEPYTFGRANILGFNPSLNLACLSETVALAMSGVSRSYSMGNRIPYSQAMQIYELALSHGFSDCIATTEGEMDLVALGYTPQNFVHQNI